jgi:hypothetical protein
VGEISACKTDGSPCDANGLMCRLMVVRAFRPIEQARQSSQRKANGVSGPARFYFPLDEKVELFAKEQILGRDGGCAPEAQPYQG